MAGMSDMQSLWWCRTNAKFFAMLDRQLQPDAERSLGRYYKRVVALRDKHQNEGYAEVRRAQHHMRCVYSAYLNACHF